MATVTSSFTEAGVSSSVYIKQGDVLRFSLSGTFVADVWIEYSDNAQTWQKLKKYSSAVTNANIQVDFSGFKDGYARLNCEVYTSGTAVATLVSLLVHKEKTIFNVAKGSKAGATAGWVVGGAADTSLVTLPASQTSSTLVMPVHFNNSGKKIVGFYLIGQVESGGNAVVLDCVLKKHSAVASDVTTTTIASMTQVSVTADTALTSANTLTDVRDEVIGENDTYFFLITGTTLGSTDVALQGIGVLLA